MVIVNREVIKDIPVLHVVKQDSMQETLPFILFVHGFTSVKERNLTIAYLLAEKGFRVVMPEALLHGERSEGYDEFKLGLNFWKIVKNTIHELEVLKNEYVRMGLADETRIGISGTSMGGIITMGSLRRYDWIKSAVCLMGSPAYVEFAEFQVENVRKVVKEMPMTEEEIQQEYEGLKEYDPSLSVEEWRPIPLLFWHGDRDSVVPYHSAYNFYEKLKPLYDESGGEISFLLEEKGVHIVSHYAMLEATKWFEKHL
ncbi:prolyl oligopeptidase family serine peptidase [Peribacillus alkalitolerans]|uniref:prolyl oligopeptidase family serine peptidase n=1 Tax=Peribacillus alkalitolerans TaxID=1550385 RepID=UPI0013D69DCF|nr:prolyl oligopeptidase family serine peptidase [Peribacillus alkalitolerans]